MLRDDKILQKQLKFLIDSTEKVYTPKKKHARAIPGNKKVINKSKNCINFK